MINKSLARVKELCKVLKINKISNKMIIKLYRLLKNKIKKPFHLMWERDPLALEPAEQGYPCIEIDENSIKVNANLVIWDFGITDLNDKDACIFCALNDRKKHSYL